MINLNRRVSQSLWEHGELEACIPKQNSWILSDFVICLFTAKASKEEEKESPQATTKMRNVAFEVNSISPTIATCGLLLTVGYEGTHQ